MKHAELTDAPGSAIVVARSEDVPEGDRIVIAVADQEIGVFRVKGRLYAWANECAHLGGPVCQGLLINRVRERLDDQGRSLGDYFGDEPHIVCPWHGYEFNIETGVHPGKSTARLRGYPVFERDGDVHVQL